MRVNLKLLLSVLMLLVAFAFSGCGDSEEKKAAEKANTAKVLGELWEGLKAKNQEPYNSLKDKTFELSVAIISPASQLKPGGILNDGGKKAVEALTMLESVSLSGPQKIVIMMTPEEVAAIQADKDVPVVWGTLKATVGGSLYSTMFGSKNLLAFSLAQDAATIKLSKDEIWPIPATFWHQPMQSQLKMLVLAIEVYLIDNRKAPENLEAIHDYGYRSNPSIKVEFTPGQTSDGEVSYVAVVFSPDGKYKMTLNYPGYDLASIRAVPVE